MVKFLAVYYFAQKYSITCKVLSAPWQNRQNVMSLLSTRVNTLRHLFTV